MKADGIQFKMKIGRDIKCPLVGRYSTNNILSLANNIYTYKQAVQMPWKYSYLNTKRLAGWSRQIYSHVKKNGR